MVSAIVSAPMPIPTRENELLRETLENQVAPVAFEEPRDNLRRSLCAASRTSARG
jgi:hypothetical protein